MFYSPPPPPLFSTSLQPTESSSPQFPLSPRDQKPLQQVAMVLVKEKAGRFQVVKVSVEVVKVGIDVVKLGVEIFDS